MAAVQRRSIQVNELGHSTNRLRQTHGEGERERERQICRQPEDRERATQERQANSQRARRQPECRVLVTQLCTRLRTIPETERLRATETEMRTERGKERETGGYADSPKRARDREADREMDRQGSATVRGAVRCAVRCGARCGATRTFTVEAGKSMDFEGSCRETLVVSGGRGLPCAGDVAGTGHVGPQPISQSNGEIKR